MGVIPEGFLMFSAPVPDDDAGRVETLHSYAILDTPPERGYDDVTALATCICSTPYSTVTFVDKDRQWFKSEAGFGTTETGRSEAFCAWAILQRETLVVEDTLLDPRFANNPFVLDGPRIRFYAGAPVVAPNGHVLGTVCVFDDKPRRLTSSQIAALEALARQVQALLEQRKTIARLENAISAAAGADRVMHESELRLQALVDFFPTLAFVANADGWITWYNHRWYEYTGTTPKEMEGWGWQSVHDPEMLPQVMERWTASIEKREPFEMIFPLRGADGVLRSFLTRIVPIRDEAGAVLQWVGSNTEVDELQRTQLALEASEAGLQQVLTATSDAVISVNREWVLTYLNPAAERLYGPPEDLLGKNVWSAFPQAVYDGSPFLKYTREAMEEGIAGKFEAEYDPLNLILSVEVYPSREGIVTFSRDITKRRMAEAALLENEKLAAVGRLASSIAHEINNPLEAIMNLVYLATLSDDVEEIRAHLRLADAELRRTSAIASQTLRFHKQTTEPIHATCEDMLASALDLHQQRIANSGVQVERRKRARNAVLCFDGEIRQVLSNLAGNAIDAMHGRGGRLLVRSRDGHDWTTGRPGLVITVADTGTGMAAGTLGKLFKPFFTTKGMSGTGLGLWISKEIVDRHHGRLTVRSSQGASKAGTVFTVFLPFDAAGR